jgi:hypothetical protein
MKLYVAVTDELTNMCHGYTEVELSSAVQEDVAGETRNEQLYRVVNSVRNIRNSNYHGFILVTRGFFAQFYIKEGRAMFVRGGKEKYFDYKVI